MKFSRGRKRMENRLEIASRNTNQRSNRKTPEMRFRTPKIANEFEAMARYGKRGRSRQPKDSPKMLFRFPNFGADPKNDVVKSDDFYTGTFRHFYTGPSTTTRQLPINAFNCGCCYPTGGRTT